MPYPLAQPRLRRHHGSVDEPGWLAAFRLSRRYHQAPCGAGQQMLPLRSSRCWIELQGREATVGLLIVQGLIWYFTPNALEKWCPRCAFGTGLERDFFVDHVVKRYID
jgi:hypothetical protein